MTAQPSWYFNAMGSSGRFRYEQRTTDVREDETLLELYFICEIDDARELDVADIASKVAIRSDILS